MIDFGLLETTTRLWVVHALSHLVMKKCRFYMLYTTPSIYRSHFRVVHSDQGEINSASERSCMQTVELTRPVRGAACAWKKVKIVVPSLDDSDSWRIFFR
jgi:hypothetical protein